MQILLPKIHFLLLLLSVVVAVAVAVMVMVLVAVILIVLVLNSISCTCGSSKILTWTGKYKSGVGARAGKYKLRARAGKCKLGARGQETLKTRKNVALQNNVTYHSQKRILRVFYYVKFLLNM